MTKVVRFTKIRYLMFVVSLSLILAGIVGTISLGGFNLGIDFQAGLSQRVQIAPVGFTLSYTGSGAATLDINSGTAVLEVRGDEGVTKHRFPLADYSTIQALADVLNGIDGITASAQRPSARPSTIATGLDFPLSLSTEAQGVNVSPDGTESAVEINQIRDALATFDNPQVQVVGDPSRQEFLLRIADPAGGNKDAYEKKIVLDLEKAFGDGTAVVKQSDYVGPRFSQDLASQSVSLTILALVLILVYIWVRFRFGFAISSITALVHDVLIMLGFIGVFRLEVSTTTIAAVLTIVGYSLNDTIVVFDRIRENMGLMKDRPMDVIIDTSITQSLSRTLMTSLTTLLAVLALYFFGTGAIKDFALNLIVGIVVGTYSSIFIASPVLLGITRASDKRKAKKLGSHAPASGTKGGAALSVESSTAGEESSELVSGPVEIPKADRKLKGKRQQKRKK
ncbi:protein translocase subunit SecF [Sediminispirochaeta smaragdinae]|uniref:Protein-export membrane protein SecF n=1 Tax=Sediminispirochaeta smaragdinae (strain DSM 11293 / JCM 15392 / SEBR 4228) TaxID=573413 RepID=E1R5K6_SEDSS|nr:protein translocase subunit SecF [Sediminispirochaeta smaragdinae]ADK82334.1 protein-export membrane protein SecF [Sediminispirochaeta smaragdinae DSM 11293]